MDLLKRVFDGEIKGIDEKERTLTAYVSTGARDRMDEVLMPDGVDLKAYKKNPVVLWAHNYNQPPIGKALWIKKDGEGIVSKVQFANTEFAQEIFGLYKDGYMKAFSVGFIPKEHEDGDGKKTPRRTYKKWEMLEYSAVPVPANPEALALAMQKGVLKIDDNLKEMLTQKKEEKETFKCECIDCGHTMTSEQHCKDLTCPECGGQMRRAERPGPGQEGMKEEPKPEKANPELLTELGEARKEIFNLKNTIIDLRWKLLQAEKPKKEKDLSEMTDDEIRKIIKDEVIGVVRKITGKVN